MKTLANQQESYFAEWDAPTRKVTVTTTLTIEQIRATISEADWNYVMELVKRYRGKRLVFINSTLRGGGVVIMRKTLIALLQMLGVDADWYVLSPNELAFEFTKWTIHNGLQGVPGAIPLDQAQPRMAAYFKWIDGEAQVLRPVMAGADVVVIDDWQPSRLIMYAKKWGLTCKIILRDHIQTLGRKMVTPGTLQEPIWRLLWTKNRICDADVFVTHPREIFVPPNVPRRMVAFMPATVEPTDELLREPTPEEVVTERAWLSQQFTRYGHTPLDFGRRYILLMARFDESKFMEGALEYYARARQRLIDQGVPIEQIAQLGLLGNGATDDPSGRKCLAKIRRLVRTKYRSIRDDIHVARVPHRDLAINVAMRGAWLVLQPSIAEGFESRVTDAIWVGVPVIGSTEGGIPLQILEGLSGFIRNPYDFDAWADIIVDLATNEKRYQLLRDTTLEAAKTHNVRFTTIKNAISWLTLAIMVLENSEYGFNLQWADSIELSGLDHPNRVLPTTLMPEPV